MFNSIVSVNIKRQLLFKAQRLGDLSVLLATWAFLTWVHYRAEEATAASWSEFLSWRVSIQNVVIMVGILILWAQSFRLVGLYDLGRAAPMGRETRDVWKATAIASAGIAAAGTLFRMEIVTPWFVIALWLLSSLFTVVLRLVLRWYVAQRSAHGSHFRRILVVGTNSRARRMARDIEERPDMGYRVIGFWDTSPGAVSTEPLPKPLLAEYGRFPEFLREHVVDEVIICLPLASCYREASRIMQLCEEQGVVVRVLGSIFDAKLARMSAEDFCSHSVLTFHVGRMQGGTVLVKRLVDVVGASLTLGALLPVLLLIAVVVKWDSPGPALFIQERVGLNKRRFRLYKFRTMVTDAEKLQKDLEHLNEVQGAAFKITRDPRVTRTGHFLRTTSLDELPQLFNVVKGDMSLVGPRPLPPRDYREFSEDWHRRRFSVPPGITCLWQVSGRSRLSFNRWMELDMEYIDRWSLSLDLHILMRTIPVVLRRDGAV